MGAEPLHWTNKLLFLQTFLSQGALEIAEINQKAQHAAAMPLLRSEASFWRQDEKQSGTHQLWSKLWLWLLGTRVVHWYDSSTDRASTERKVPGRSHIPSRREVLRVLSDILISNPATPFHTIPPPNRDSISLHPHPWKCTKIECGTRIGLPTFQPRAGNPVSLSAGAVQTCRLNHLEALDHPITPGLDSHP